MSLIKLLKDKDGNTLYPQTTAEAVFTSGGNNLQNKLNEYDSHQYLEQVIEMPNDISDYAFQAIYVNDVNNNYNKNGVYVSYITDHDIDAIDYTSSTTALSADLTDFKSTMEYLQSMGAIQEVFPADSFKIIYAGKDENDYYFSIPLLMSGPDEVISKTDLASSDFGINIIINDENALQLNDTITIKLGCESGWRCINNSYSSTVPTSQKDIQSAPDIIHYAGVYQPKQEGTDKYNELDEVPALIPGNLYKKISSIIYDPDNSIAVPSTENIQINSFDLNKSLVFLAVYNAYAQDPYALRYMLNMYGNGTITYTAENCFTFSNEEMSLDYNDKVILQAYFGLDFSYTEPLQIGDSITISTSLISFLSWEPLQTDFEGNAQFLGNVSVKKLIGTKEHPIDFKDLFEGIGDETAWYVGEKRGQCILQGTINLLDADLNSKGTTTIGTLFNADANDSILFDYYYMGIGDLEASIIYLSTAGWSVWASAPQLLTFGYIFGGWEDTTGFVEEPTITELATVNDIVQFQNKVLTKTNTTKYEPTDNYNPATKKYVDDRSYYLCKISDWSSTESAYAQLTQIQMSDSSIILIEDDINQDSIPYSYSEFVPEHPIIKDDGVKLCVQYIFTKTCLNTIKNLICNITYPMKEDISISEMTFEFERTSTSLLFISDAEAYEPIS